VLKRKSTLSEDTVFTAIQVKTFTNKFFQDKSKKNHVLRILRYWGHDLK